MRIISQRAYKPRQTSWRIGCNSEELNVSCVLCLEDAATQTNHLRRWPNWPIIVSWGHSASMPPTVHGGRRRRSLTFRGWASVGTPRRRQFGGGALPSCFPRRGLAKVSFRVCFFPSFCRTLNGSKTLHETSTKLLGRGRLSPQLPLSHPNRTDARWTVQKRTRPTFERLSPQLLPS